MNVSKRIASGPLLRRQNIVELVFESAGTRTQVTVEFTYSGYHITVEQSGAAKFVHVT